MKKVYTRPELFYENFSLMEAIAACSFFAQHATKETCSYYAKEWDANIFITELGNGCDIDAESYGNSNASWIFSS